LRVFDLSPSSEPRFEGCWATDLARLRILPFF
jgi:hypothetical protein